MVKADGFQEKDKSKYLLTWNSFGNKFDKLVTYLDKTAGIESKINVVCCQEFGSPAALSDPDEIRSDYSYKFIRFHSRPGGMHVFWHSWSRTHNPRDVSDNLRCTVAIIRCGQQGDQPSCEVLLDSAQRPVIGIEYGDAWIYSFHNDAHGGAAIAAKSMIDWVEMCNKGRMWIIAGDFNCNPGTLNGNFKVRCDTTKSTTRRNSLTGMEIANNHYDYVVQSNRGVGDQDMRRLSHHIAQRQLPTILSSDHFPVLAQIYSTKGF